MINAELARFEDEAIAAIPDLAISGIPTPADMQDFPEKKLFCSWYGSQG